MSTNVHYFRPHVNHVTISLSGFQKCPLCGTSVKLENLPRHMKRVHPRAQAPIEAPGRQLDLKARSSPLERRLRQRRVLTALLLVGLLGAAVAAYVIALHMASGPQPRIQVSPTSYDFGDIQPEIVAASFTIQNLGQGELVLLSIATSCMCTTAVFRFRGRDSPVFGAHGNPEGWSETLGPGESGQLIVAYDPNLHPDSGPIVRAVYIRSNDPASPEVSIVITANVVRS